MKIIDCDWTKRNGNGHSTCHLCNKLTWDSFCYDFDLKILDKELFNTVLCDDCISRIKKELECKMVSNEKTIEEVEDKEYEDIEELDVALLGQCDNWLRCPTNEVTKQDIELNPYIINSVRENTLEFQHKINALIRNQKYILEQLNKEGK